MLHIMSIHDNRMWYDKTINIQYQTAGTIQKSDIEIVERGKINTKINNYKKKGKCTYLFFVIVYF